MELPVLRTERLTLRPLEEDDLDAVARIVSAPGVVEWWNPVEDAEHLREGLRSDGSAFAICIEGEIAGWLGVSEEPDPDYRCASLDIALAPPHQDRGLGSEALRAVIRWLVAERGHHRITIDPAAANARAIRAYEAVGFRPVGVMRRYERRSDGAWHDNLLMDLLAEELPPTP